MKDTLKILFVFLLIFVSATVRSQNRSIAITIDDVPNVKQLKDDGYRHRLLRVIDSMKIPVTIFVNPGNLEEPDSAGLNKKLLQAWTRNRRVTIGNHGCHHLRYSEQGLEKFAADIECSHNSLKKMAARYKKSVRYFRFPFNDLGKDSLEHIRADSLMKTFRYSTAPFTAESSDWKYNYAYAYFVKQGEHEKAASIGRLYVQKTMEIIHFFDSLSVVVYGYPVKQIYLCHDNLLNTVYLPEIVKQLKAEKYRITSMDDALRDKAYKQTDLFYEKWGISWLYRWMPAGEERKNWRQKEPDMDDLEAIYGAVRKME